MAETITLCPKPFNHFYVPSLRIADDRITKILVVMDNRSLGKYEPYSSFSNIFIQKIICAYNAVRTMG